MHIDRVIKLEARFKQRAREIYRDALRCKWNSRQINQAVIRHLWSDTDFKRMPRYARSYIRGYVDALRDAYDANLVYTYEVFGQRLAIDSAAACLKRLLDAYDENDHDEMREAASDLVAWMLRGGFPPQLSEFTGVKERKAIDRLLLYGTDSIVGGGTF